MLPTDKKHGMTLLEVLVVVVVMGILLLLLLPMLARAREEGRRKVCQENLSQINLAFFAYSQCNYEFFPFSEAPADKQSPRKKDAMTSLATIYDETLDDAKVFSCPSAKKRSWIRTNVPHPITDRNGDGKVSDDDVLPGEKYIWDNRNYTVMNSSYGYDCRLYPSAWSNHAIIADMDGSQDPSDKKKGTGNHRGGGHVLYVDGSVHWQTINFCSNNPEDNIFTEDPWHADTDSFISDNTPPGSDDTPGAFNDLSVSYDSYPLLHPDE